MTATLIYRSRTSGVTSPSTTKGEPLTNTDIDDNFYNLSAEVDLKLNSSAYTAADVLTKLKTVDGSGSGLDADLLDGKTTASENTANTVVIRDGSGNFSAGVITASLIGNVTGNADTVTNGVYTDAVYNNPAWLTALAGSKVTSIPNSSLQNSSVTINGTAVSLGGSISISGSSNTWTAQQTFRDNLFTITDDGDTSRSLNFQLSGITAGTNRVLFAPDETGTIATQSYVNSSSNNVGTLSAPAAAIAYFARSSAPSGWLKANGAAVSRTAYAALFSAIGTYYGAGDGSTTFNVPDLRGEFLRAWDDGRGVDTNRGFGSFQGQDWKTLFLQDAGQNSSSNYTHDEIGIKRTTKVGVNDGTLNLFMGYWSNRSAHLNGYWGSEEIRPRNVALLVCIKY